MVLPDSAEITGTSAQHTHHMGHDADVANIISRLLKLYQLFRRDYRHIGDVLCVRACPNSRQARRWCGCVVWECNPVSRRGCVSTVIKGLAAEDKETKGSCLRQVVKVQRRRVVAAENV